MRSAMAFHLASHGVSYCKVGSVGKLLSTSWHRAYLPKKFSGGLDKRVVYDYNLGKDYEGGPRNDRA